MARKKNGLPAIELTRNYSQRDSAAVRLESKQAETAEVYGKDLVSLNGRKPVKELNERHKNIIALHLAGVSGVKIAAHLKVSAATVYGTLQDPLAKELITFFRTSLDEDLMALKGLSIDAIRDGLNSSDKELRLKATDRWLKMTRKDEELGDGRVSGNVIGEIRARFIIELSQAAEKAGIIDGEARDITPTEDVVEAGALPAPKDSARRAHSPSEG